MRVRGRRPVNDNYARHSLECEVRFFNGEIPFLKSEIQRLNSLIIKFGNMYNFPLNIIFRSMNGAINCFIPCYYNELFAMVEERLYQFFPYLRNPNNQFVCNGKPVKRNESLIQNEIFDKNVILIITPN